MIARDAGWTPEPSLEVYDKDGQRVGCVDQASDAQRWMQAEDLGLGLQRPWILYRLIKSVGDRDVMVTLTEDEIQTPLSPSLVIGG